MEFLAGIQSLKALEAFLWTTGVGGFILGLRFLFKTFRSDVQEVKVDGEQDIVLKHWKELADRYQKEALDNAKRADMFADQRNKAIEEVGQLRGEVNGLTKHISNLETQIGAMQKTVMHLEAMLSKCAHCEMGKSMQELLQNPLFPDVCPIVPIKGD